MLHERPTFKALEPIVASMRSGREACRKHRASSLMNFRFRMPVTQVSLPSHDPGMNPPQPALDEALENVYTVCVVTPP
ncbi:hypothetical protein MPTK1_2g08290 [Marchantia polymorpha subsp. ruderalis]|uniref:Uncharacterized protein n=1 Tax=Marchantia polymorpha TaxID=3197 RepID=A0A2R6XGT4_MARPO|nr:hypothetical protein MARPO_0015s0114 [Marchantia polymorpha]BBN01550.1 hypothetical protein Mp_2g08290 [Marchantia polymorpha subsp. ruderalis]|eukprot:PTQ45316.1 hypothetical protein MARPO_0015s0114 [Marchantia polymorpha]